MVELNAAVALLGRFPALTGVDLRIEPGETVLLQGPNGAGKTTLLRLCAGLLAPESGSVTVLGPRPHDRSRASCRAPPVGLLGHSTGLYRTSRSPRTSASGHGPPGSTPNRRWSGWSAPSSAWALDDGLLDLPVHRLSAGQRRRTSLAALVVRRPELWLLDEPHAGLDQAGRNVVDTLIGDAVAAGGTVVVSSHELERVRSLSPRVVTLAGGTVHRDTNA